VLTHDLPNDIRIVFYVHIKGTELQTDYAQLLLYQEVVLEGQVKVELRQILADGLPAASTRMGGGMAVGSDGALYLGTGVLRARFYGFPFQPMFPLFGENLKFGQRVFTTLLGWPFSLLRTISMLLTWVPVLLWHATGTRSILFKKIKTMVSLLCLGEGQARRIALPSFTQREFGFGIRGVWSQWARDRGTIAWYGQG
jgi:hypothetical protein